MQVKGKTVAITGGASGIGAALARRFHADGAKAITIADIDMEQAATVAAEVGGHAFEIDAGDATAVRAFIEASEALSGPIDLYCSNAGLGFSDAPDWNAAGTSNDNWQTSWDVNVMAHVHAARVLIPRWQARGNGYFLITASAAGLLTQIGDAAYAATKHAAVGYAEALSITHGDEGIGVSVLCPQAVDTPLIKGIEKGAHSIDGILSVEDVADAVIRGLAAEQFLILTHDDTATHMAHKAGDLTRWLKGMRRLRARLIEKLGQPM